MRHGGNSGLTTIAYTTAGQLAEAFDEWTEGHKAYQEPHAQVVGAAEMAAALGSGDSGCGLETGVFKVTWWGSEAAVAAALSALLVTLGEDAEVIRSLANCVEVLPQGCGKAQGVQVALDLLGVETSNVLALGDGENDSAMLSMVREGGGVSVAMGNADAGGVAAAVRRFCLGQTNKLEDSVI